MIRVDDRDDLNWSQGPGRGTDSPELRPRALTGETIVTAAGSGDSTARFSSEVP